MTGAMSTTIVTRRFAHRRSEKGVRTLLPGRPFGCSAQKGPDPFFRPAFTLVEMMVVIGILAVLVSLVMSTASSLLANSRATQTKATMHIIEAAIEQFIRDGALNTVAGRQMRQNVWDSTRIDPYSRMFNQYPPSPTAAFAPDPAALATFTKYLVPPNPTPPNPAPPYPAITAENTETIAKFIRLLNVMNGLDVSLTPPSTPWIMRNNNVPAQQITAAAQGYTENYPSIECLIFALRQFSPSARDIIDRLPSSILTNLDKDFAYHDTMPVVSGGLDGSYQNGEEQATLFEVLDAWKQPLRYAIREPIRDPNATDPGAPPIAPLRWELRSAGQNGEFSPPFTEESQSDDVIVQGP